MKINDIVVDKRTLGTIIGKTLDGKWVVEWASKDFGELETFEEEMLFLVEESNGLLSEN
jgi:hypothetical protein